MKQSTELLAPAGSRASLEAAIAAGADAVYIGGSMFGARAFADNPEEEQLIGMIDYVHLFQKKIYLTVNTLVKDRELAQISEFVRPYYLAGIDGVIVQDLGVLSLLREEFPDLPLHASTQMSISAAPAVGLLKSLGVTRVVPARELSLTEIRKLKETGIELECFIHGAMCYSYSGQCLFSSILGGRSGNRGQCAQPCRLPYRVDGRTGDVLSLKDMCTIDLLPNLIAAGIDSFKIEGRMKQPEYVYTVVSIYRKYIDRYLKDPAAYKVSTQDRRELQEAYRRRGYSQGYYRQHNSADMLSLERPAGSGEGQNRPEQHDHADGSDPDRYRRQLEIYGSIRLITGEPAELSAECGKIAVTVTGSPVQPAQKRPLTKEQVKEKITRTGGTNFTFASLQIQMDEAVFMPVSQLNDLRRDALEQLQAAILAPYRRMPASGAAEAPGAEQSTRKATQPETQRLSGLCVSVETADQLAVCRQSAAVTEIIVDSSLTGRNAVNDAAVKDKKLLLGLPNVFRNDTIEMFDKWYPELAARYDGMLVRNPEELQWLKSRGYQKEIRSDASLYVFNRRSKAVLGEAGVGGFTAPFELNRHELAELGLADCDLIVYGRIPLMTTANCVHNTLAGCDHRGQVLYLQDRYHKNFPVKNYCRDCYNIIYNSTPLMLTGQRDAVRRLDPQRLRLMFTIEDAAQTAQVLTLYEQVFLRGEAPAEIPGEFTKGHFDRGVK